MASRLNPSTFGYQNFYSGTIQTDITSSTLTISLDTVPTPTSGILVIDPDSSSAREVILYTSKGASTITCPSDGRGYDSTTATSHLTGTTVIMAPISKWFTALASGELSTDPLRTELFFDYVASGCVWSGDSYGSTRNASMTSGVIYINGRRLTVDTVTSRSFTASKDTYIDASDSGDGTATVTYTEVTNNAASPSLATNSMRLGIIVTGASNIANAGSVNQGQEDKVLPVASSVAYTTTDSLGNLICPRDPNRKLLGYRRITSTFNYNASTSPTQVTGLSCPVIVPPNRGVQVTIQTRLLANTVDGKFSYMGIWSGTVGSGTALGEGLAYVNTGAGGAPLSHTARNTPSVSSVTYNASATTASGGLVQISATTTAPAYIKVELD